MLLAVANQKYQMSKYALDITESTNDGIDLYKFFVSKVGRHPLADESVTFTVKPGVTIIGPNPNVAAIEAGNGWTTINTLKIINRGNIFGRGGTGGRSAYHYKYILGASNASSQVSSSNTRPARPGGSGGTAVNSPIAPCVVDNYGFIAGGGGGGGGLGIYRGDTLRSVGGGGTGGGAPFGKRSPNEGTYSMYLEDTELDAKKFTTWRDIWVNNSATVGNKTDANVFYQHRNNAYLVTAWQGALNLGAEYRTAADSEARCVFMELDKKSAHLNEPYTQYLAFLDGSREYVTAYSQDSILHHPVVTFMSTDGSLDKGGLGGAGLVADGWYSQGNHGQSYPLDIINNPNDPRQPRHTTYGGHGGDIGEAGMSGTNTLYYASSSTSRWTFTDRSKCLWQTPNAPGGPAGLVKSGKVSINNITGGIVKGN